MSGNTPILFQIYNSPDISARVFNEIKKIRPKQLFLIQDGLRIGTSKEDYLKTRETILNMIDWECDLKTLFREENLGPGAGTADAVKWFFEHVEAGIVLEYDCLPHPDFFEFCEILLEKYKNNPEIRLITGSNYQGRKTFGKYSYYFGKTAQLWGWAAWKRTFTDYDQNIDSFDQDEVFENIDKTFEKKRLREYWKTTFRWTKSKSIDTWDYQMIYSIWKNNELIIIPNKNLISNIGFSKDALHCKDTGSGLANAKTYPILPLNHPHEIKRSYAADNGLHDHYLRFKPRPMEIFIFNIKSGIRKLFPKK